jgi:hypothetical protein
MIYLIDPKDICANNKCWPIIWCRPDNHPMYGVDPCNRF